MCETWRSAATPCLLWLRGHALARLPLRPALLLLCFEASVEGLRFRKIGFRRRLTGSMSSSGTPRSSAGSCRSRPGSSSSRCHTPSRRRRVRSTMSTITVSVCLLHAKNPSSADSNATRTPPDNAHFSIRRTPRRSPSFYPNHLIPFFFAPHAFLVYVLQHTLQEKLLRLKQRAGAGADDADLRPISRPTLNGTPRGGIYGLKQYAYKGSPQSGRPKVSLAQELTALLPIHARLKSLLPRCIPRCILCSFPSSLLSPSPPTPSSGDCS